MPARSTVRPRSLCPSRSQWIPTSTATSHGGRTLFGAGQYALKVTPLGGVAAPLAEPGPVPLDEPAPVMETESLPSGRSLEPDGSWVDGNGVPFQLTFGWSASTGAVEDYHTISNVNVQTLNGSPPALGVTLSDASDGTAHSGQTVKYFAATTLSGSDELRTITLTDTFPAGLVPQSTGLVATGWSCGVSGQTVTCTYPPTPRRAPGLRFAYRCLSPSRPVGRLARRHRDCRRTRRHSGNRHRHPDLLGGTDGDGAGLRY